MKINYMLDRNALPPVKAHVADAGIDLRTPAGFRLRAHSSVTISTGVHMEIPEGWCGFLKSKSGLNVKHSITSEGVIDSGYTGPIMCKLYNNSNKDYDFGPGDKITQLVILPTPFIELIGVDEFEETERGDSGFGSTGK